MAGENCEVEALSVAAGGESKKTGLESSAHATVSVCACVGTLQHNLSSSCWCGCDRLIDQTDFFSHLRSIKRNREHVITSIAAAPWETNKHIL